MNDPDIRLLGIGGCGGRLADAVARAAGGRMQSVAIDTDYASVDALAACRPLKIGTVHFRGLGSGGDASAAAMAATEESTTLATVIDGAALLVVAAGLGGGTGSGMLPVVLRLAQSRNVPTLVVTVSPFRFEGLERLKAAAAAARSLEGLGTVRVRLANDDLVVAPEGAGQSLQEALLRAAEIAGAAMASIWTLGTRPAFLHLDASTLLETLACGRGDAHFSFAEAAGEDRAALAARDVLERPGLGLRARADEIRGALVGVVGGTDLRLEEIGIASRALSGILPTGTPVRLSVALDSAREGSLRMFVLAFTSWNAVAVAASDGAATSIHAPDRFAGIAPSPVGGENLDEPTWLRRNLRLAV